MVRDIRPIEFFSKSTRSLRTIYFPDPIPKGLQSFSNLVIDKSHQDLNGNACVVYIGNIVEEYFNEIVRLSSDCHLIYI